MPRDSRPSIVLIIDALELRRAGIASLIDAWAQPINLSTDAIAPDDLSSYAEKAQNVQFIILSIGGSSLREIEIHDCAGRVRALFPAIPCAIISDRKEADEAVAAATLGEQAFLSTSMQPDVVCQALTFILGGGTYFPREALLQSASGKLPDRAHSAQLYDADGDALTRRQYEVLEKLRFGKSNKQIARDLSMQESTVKVHVRQIMRKLGAANRTQAALLASSTLVPHNGSLVEDNGAALHLSRTLPHAAIQVDILQVATLPQA